MKISEQKTVISGIGRSQVGRRLGIDPWHLTAVAAKAAIRDAGLEPGDIDGVSTYPGAVGQTPGFTGAGAFDVKNLLGLKLKWFTGGIEVPGQLGSVINAVAAVSAGLANHVLCFRTVWESTAQSQAGNRAEVQKYNLDRSLFAWWDPYGFGNPCYGAMLMQRYMHMSGAKREQIGWMAVNGRRNAADNPAAVYRTPLTIDEYMSARMISDPLCLLDCDVPVDGSYAVVVSRADSPRINKNRSVSVQSIGSAIGFDEVGDMLWERTDLKPKDVKIAQLYDGFSILAVRWMEALKLVPQYEAARFIDGGTRIARDGELPLNTSGGQLSAGRMHGYVGMYEAVEQLRNAAGVRQVTPRPDVCVVTTGAEAFTSAVLLAL